MTTTPGTEEHYDEMVAKMTDEELVDAHAGNALSTYATNFSDRLWAVTMKMRDITRAELLKRLSGAA